MILGLKKDPGIPNLYPFKEQLLKEIEDRKQRVYATFLLLIIINYSVYGHRPKRPENDRRKNGVKSILKSGGAWRDYRKMLRKETRNLTRK